MAAVTSITAAAIAWAKIKFYYAHTLSGLTATSTAAGYDVENLLNRLEINGWKATTSGAQEIVYDAGAGNTYTADYVALSGHNLFTADSLITVEYSSDNFGGDINPVFGFETPADDNEYVKEFTSNTARYWRIRVISSLVAIEIGIAYWGEKTELDYATTSFDPNSMADKANVNVSETGYVLGVHSRYTERQFNMQFGDSDEELYTKIKTWFEAIKQENFFVAWEIDQHPDDVFLMRSTGKLTAPLVRGGLYRNANVSLIGRMQ